MFEFEEAPANDYAGVPVDDEFSKVEFEDELISQHLPSPVSRDAMGSSFADLDSISRTTTDEDLVQVETRTSHEDLLSDLHLCPLGDSFFLHSFRREKLQSVCKAILHVLFEAKRKSGFFSFTDVDDHISVILDTEMAHIFQDYGVTINFNQPWSSLKVI